MRFCKRLIALVCILLVFSIAAPIVFETASPAVVTTAQAASKPKLNVKKVSLSTGDTYQLKVKNAGKKKVKWSSSDKSVVKVSKSGKITAKQQGVAVITAKVGSKELKCKVTVTSRLTANKTALVLNPGEKAKIKIRVYPKQEYSSYTVYYYNDNIDVADCDWASDSFDSNGKNALVVKALRSGTTNITLTWSQTKDTIVIPVTVN